MDFLHEHYRLHRTELEVESVRFDAERADAEAAAAAKKAQEATKNTIVNDFAIVPEESQCSYTGISPAMNTARIHHS